MSTEQHRNRLLKTMATASVVVGLAAGSYGIASAATGSSSSSGSTAGTTTTAQSGTPAAAPDASHPWGGQRSDETPLTGDALAKVSGGTVVRVETDADGNAAYEAHMTKSDGTPVTVYVDKDFNFVSIETR